MRSLATRSTVLALLLGTVACNGNGGVESAHLDAGGYHVVTLGSSFDAGIDAQVHVVVDATATASKDARTSDSTSSDTNPLRSGDATNDARVTDARRDTGPLTTTVTVHYPVPVGHTLTLRGSGGSLNWTSGTLLAGSARGDAGADHVWSLQLELSAAVEVKPLYDDTTWAIGPNWTIEPGVALDIWPHFFTQNGTITEIDNWYSHTLNNSRTIWVYLPPSAAENPDERFPVAYFQDGQNDFYDDLSYSGTSWNLQGAMDQGAGDGTIHESIIIAIANAGTGRTWEYTPTPGGMDGGGAPLYLTFVATELKPQMDRQFPTVPDRPHTAICGSSLGGLVSLYASLTRGEVFGLIGALSPSTWWDNEWVLGEVLASATAPYPPLLLYLDSGNAGVFPQPDPWPAQANYDDWTQTAQLASAYREAGADMDYLIQDGGQHSEVYWRQRVPGTLAFLFGPR